MLRHWIATQNPHFHPSVHMVAPSPDGRVASPGQLALHVWGKAAAERRNVMASVFTLGVLIVVLSVLVLWLLSVSNPLIWLAGTFIPVLVYGTIVSLDWVFWLIRRAHDLGRSALWAIIPIVILTIAPYVALYGVLVDNGQAAMTIVFAAMIGGALLSSTMLIWITFAKGDPGPNKYGPPPDPIPDYWLN